MGIDNSSILFFGFYIELEPLREYLSSVAEADLKEDESVDPDSLSIAELIEFTADLVDGNLTEDEKLKFEFGSAAPYYDAPEESRSYFFGIVLHSVSIEMMLKLANWEQEIGYDKVRKIGLHVGIPLDISPSLHSEPHVY